jgi:Ca2+-binding RTX toxin-like protein
MSGSSSVTLPGSGGLPVTIAMGTGDVQQLAAQIGALLSTIQGAGNLVVTDGTVDSVPVSPIVVPPTVNELVLSGSGPASATIPSGYPYVIDQSSGPSTITGANLALITGTVGGTYNVTGQSTVVVMGGNNLVTANGQYLISTSVGNNTISASGTGTIADDAGANVIFASGASNLVSSIGTDTVVAGVGITTVNASGSLTEIFGSSDGNALLFASVSGSQATVAAFNSDSSINVAGDQDVVFGSAALSNIFVSGTNATLVGGSGAETVSTSSNTVMFGGTGSISFVGGAGTATIVGASGGTEQVSVGAGGALFSAGANNASTITSGAGTTTIFGGSNSVVNFVGSQSGAMFVGSGGNETLNAAGSSTTNTFSAGSGGNVSIVGGSGDDTFFAGSGADTFAGGAGSNIFAFFAGATGGHDVITDFQSSDDLYLIGYASTQSASSLQNAATVNSSGVTLTLSDSTTITFSNLNNASALNGEILYAPKTPV